MNKWLLKKTAVKFISIMICLICLIPLNTAATASSSSSALQPPFYYKDQMVFKVSSYSSSPWSFSRYIESGGERIFLFDPKQVAFAIYDEYGRRIGVGKAVGGGTWCSDVGRSCRTVRGEFQVYSKGSKYCKSGAYPRPNGGAPMPYCMHFHRGYAIHGSSDLPDKNASHGCIRVDKQTAKWLSENFIQKGTKVVVLDY